MRKNESGRSMVEMLGVLAIIGVLSIGGIAGYTLSMNRYRANAVVDVANKLAGVAYGSCMGEIAQDNTKTTSTCTAVSSGSNTAEYYGLGTPEGLTLTVTAIDATNGVTVKSSEITDTKLKDAIKSIIGDISGTNGVTIKQN
ncbi:MAG: type II secretion system protein [Alphaproteobacteria bacterium]|nr:type II secretion system protein [Alphaproteobacteria bacterium]